MYRVLIAPCGAAEGGTGIDNVARERRTGMVSNVSPGFDVRKTFDQECRMQRISYLLMAAAVCVIAAPVAAQPDGHGPQPPVFVENPDSLIFRCADTVHYQFLAVNPHSQKPMGRIHYRLVSGPGTIDSLTGQWWYFANGESPSAEASNITVAAELRHGQKILSSSCVVQLVGRGGIPGFTFYPSAESGDTLQVMAEELFKLALSIQNYDVCGPVDYQLVGLQISQFPAGTCLYGPDTAQPACNRCYALYFEPNASDAGTVFGFTFLISDGFDTVSCQLNLAVIAKPVVRDIVGDLNLNGTPFETADLLVFKDYFKLGPSALGAKADSVSKASDVNGNGIPLEMADFVYAQRIVAGNLATAMTPADTSPNLATFIHARILKRVLLADNDTLGGVQLVFAGNLGTVTAAQTGFTVESAYDAGTNVTRVLVMTTLQTGPGSPLFNPKITTGPLFAYTGTGALNSITAATKYGNPVRTTVQLSAPVAPDTDADSKPEVFGLAQNYPNPFNPSTTINFALPVAGEARLEIVNILGEVVYRYIAYCRAGMHEIVWDGTTNDGKPVASGVYYYRLQAIGQTAVKRMILLK